ncbi:right-handed parallel beta-helix repeat-containing protein [Actinomadura fulvescens]|uniref:Right handed beta helix domain-containing protein n=1 Tax=Actinomadura fulvescens TaxID=46160 RepID=A0ABN3PGN8_9ACTN
MTSRLTSSGTLVLTGAAMSGALALAAGPASAATHPAAPTSAAADGYVGPCSGYALCIHNKRSATRLTIKGKKYLGKRNGISIRNSRNVTIRGNTFRGFAANNTYAGVHVRGKSTGIIIENNTFQNIKNTSPRDNGWAHGVYIVDSDGTKVIGNNKFIGIEGDPVRVRDGSDRTIVSGNTFNGAGARALFSDWHSGREACGKNNVFKNNKYKGVPGRSGAAGYKRGSTVSLVYTFFCPPSIKNGGGNRKF